MMIAAREVGFNMPVKSDYRQLANPGQKSQLAKIRLSGPTIRVSDEDVYSSKQRVRGRVGSLTMILPPKFDLPLNLSEKAATFRESSYGVTLVALVLHDGTRIPHVHVAGRSVIKASRPEDDAQLSRLEPSQIADVLTEMEWTNYEAVVDMHLPGGYTKLRWHAGADLDFDVRTDLIPIHLRAIGSKVWLRVAVGSSTEEHKFESVIVEDRPAG